MNEIKNIIARYEQRDALPRNRYDPASPWVLMIEQEKERKLTSLLRGNGIHPFQDKKLIEIGCGFGQNLMMFQKIGFEAKNLTAIELIESRFLKAKEMLSSSITLLLGDASEVELPYNYYDIAFQSMVFSSILDDNFRKKMAKRLFAIIKPGGSILWYDFIVNNPYNKEIRKINQKELRSLFPKCEIQILRLTLAPPLARIIAKKYQSLYTIFNRLSFLRSHILCLIKKT